MPILALDHVQLAMPPGHDSATEALREYADLHGRPVPSRRQIPYAFDRTRRQAAPCGT